jgi:hypothetical protein
MACILDVLFNAFQGHPIIFTGVFCSSSVRDDFKYLDVITDLCSLLALAFDLS